jgi:3-methyladenine DNA glycosylase AlkD
MTPDEVLGWLTQQYQIHQNPQKAREMAAYMKDLFPYWGVQTPQRRQIQQALFSQIKSIVSESWLTDTARGLWQLEQREYHYAALDLLDKFHPHLTPTALPTLEYLVVTKSWWDTVDAIASHLVGKLVLRASELLPSLDQYSTHDNLWLRRTAILHQLSFKAQTDQERLFRYCTLNGSSREFFIQKAIGWALREYAKTDQEAVVEYARANHHLLSNLSKREGLKHTGVDWKNW